MANKTPFQPVITTTEKLSEISIVNGQYIITTDSGELYLDMDNKRQRMTSKVFMVDTQHEPFGTTGYTEGDVVVVYENE